MFEDSFVFYFCLALYGSIIGVTLIICLLVALNYSIRHLFKVAKKPKLKVVK